MWSWDTFLVWHLCGVPVNFPIINFRLVSSSSTPAQYQSSDRNCPLTATGCQMAEYSEDPEDILSDSLAFLGGKQVVEDPQLGYGPLLLTVAPKVS